MPLTLISILLPYAFKAIEAYIKNSSSEKDDEILELTKKSCQYLGEKDNNTISMGTSELMQRHTMIREVE
jgi:hypothetical protein